MRNPEGCAITSTSRVAGQCDAKPCTFPFCEAFESKPVRVEPNVNANRARMIREALNRVGRHVAISSAVGCVFLELSNVARDEDLLALDAMLRNSA